MTRTAMAAEAFEHGNPRRYRRGCRCTRCKAGVAAENKQNRFLRETGRSKMVGIEAAAVHVRSLRAAGMPDAEIQAAARISPDQLYRILRGAGRIHQATDQRIRAVPVPSRARQANCAATDGTGTRRRLHALVAAGWPQAQLAARLGMFKEQVSYIAREGGSGQVTLRIAAKVSQLYAELWNQRPEEHGIAPHLALRARRLAKRRGWHPGAVWDDIDDPAEVPQYGERTARDEAIVEDTAELARQGLSRAGIAARLGVTWDYVGTAHSRQRTPLPKLAA